jgi:low temperature requirement protein LtrA
LSTIPSRPRTLRAHHLPRARLLTGAGHDRDVRHSSWLEVFFDLVFVAAIAQLASALQVDASLGGLARFAGLFTVVWWVWVMLSTYSDRFGTDDPFHRGAMLVAMLFGVGLAAAGPEAFRGHTAPFAVAYLLLKGEQLFLFERARRQNEAVRTLYTAFAATGAFSAGCWLASLGVDGPARYALWAVGLAVEMATPWLTVDAAKRAPLNVTHLPERFGLFTIIVLGESVARLVGAATLRPWTIQLCVVLAAAFAIIAAMWWISFNAVDHAAVRRGRVPTLAYIYVHLPMVASIAAASAGLHHAILAADGHGVIQVAPRVAIYGGVGLYLVATAALPAATAPQRARRVRLAAAAASFGLVAMGSFVSPVFLVPSLTVVLVAEVLLDRSGKRFPHTPALARPPAGAERVQPFLA